MRNLTLLTDLYQLTMLNGYFEKNIHEDMVIFDMFFRKNACNGGYTIVCGIEQFVEYINNSKEKFKIIYPKKRMLSVKKQNQDLMYWKVKEISKLVGPWRNRTLLSHITRNQNFLISDGLMSAQPLSYRGHNKIVT